MRFRSHDRIVANFHTDDDGVTRLCLEIHDL